MSGFYAYEAFLVIGTSDYSIVFWCLPVLFIGLGAFMLSGITWRMGKKESPIEAFDELCNLHCLSDRYTI